LIFYVILFAVYLFLVLSTASVWVRNIVRVLRLMELYAIVEIVNVLFFKPENAFIANMLEAIEATF
jgi:hypothetical protein